MRERAYQEGSELQTINATLAIASTEIIGVIHAHTLNSDVNKSRTIILKTDNKMSYCVFQL